MFGHNNDDKHDEQKHDETAHDDNTVVPNAPSQDMPPLSQPDWQHPGTPIDDQPASSSFDQPGIDPLADEPVDIPAPATDPDEPETTPTGPEPISDVISPAGGFPRSSDTQAAAHFPTPSHVIEDDTPHHNDPIIDNSADRELIDIKQRALNELSPLLDQLDQSPEEKFRTIMMMIQASDDESLVKAAYEAAHGIDDEKARAQALLDIVNEINYFTSTQQPEV